MTTQDLNEIAIILQKHQFRIDSNKDISFGVTTQYNQSFIFQTDGSSIFTLDGRSTEVVGRNIAPDSKQPAKLIYAKNGDIYLKSLNGDIILDGKNVRITATDALGGQIVLDATKIIQLMAPISNIQGDEITIAASGTVRAGGGTFEAYSQISTELTQGTDEVKASFFGKILSAIKEFKNFFGSLCEIK